MVVDPKREELERTLKAAQENTSTLVDAPPEEVIRKPVQEAPMSKAVSEVTPAPIVKSLAAQQLLERLRTTFGVVDSSGSVITKEVFINGYNFVIKKLNSMETAEVEQKALQDVMDAKPLGNNSLVYESVFLRYSAIFSIVSIDGILVADLFPTDTKNNLVKFFGVESTAKVTGPLSAEYSKLDPDTLVLHSKGALKTYVCPTCDSKIAKVEGKYFCENDGKEMQLYYEGEQSGVNP